MPWRAPPGAGATVFIWSGYSLAERDRRWQAVRQNAAKAGFDCILIPLGNGIDGRYMTQLRCSAMALPTDGREPIIIADRTSSNEWAPEPWQTGREWAEPMGEALLDLGMEGARIGVVGLKGGSVTHCRSIDGVVNHTALAYVMGKLPSATFADATNVVGLVRYIKSEEEIGFVRRSAEVAAAGLDELIKLCDRAAVGAAQRIFSHDADNRSDRYGEPQALQQSSNRQALGKERVDHQRNKCHLRRAANSTFSADLVGRYPQRMETGHWLAERSLPSGAGINKTWNHIRDATGIRQWFRREPENENRSPDAWLRLWR